MSGLLSRMSRKRKAVTSGKYSRRVRSKYGQKRRTTGRTRTVTKRRGNSMYTNNEELGQTNRYSGRRLRFTTRFTRRYVQKQTELQKYRFGQISAYGGVSGPLIFPNFQTGAGATKLAPCTLIDLSSVPNINGSTYNSPQTTWNINFTDETATSNVVFVPATSGWQFANLDTSTGGTSIVGTVPKNQDYLKWCKINFLFYTPLLIPTKISVQIVQFKDPRLIPQGTVYPAASETVSSPGFVTDFWQSYVKDYMFNPITPSSGVNMKKWLKVLHSDTFILNPKDTDETANTRYKIHKIFKNFNRSQKYNWESSDRVNLDSNDLPIRTGDNDVTVHPRARVYLVIRALSAEQENATYPPATWYNKWPSADIYIEKCHMNSS